jgi:Flp pilus assembly protein TadG
MRSVYRLRTHTRHGRLTRWPTGERGQSMVEFVLIFPMLLIFALALMEFGFMLHANISVNSAAREGARFAAVANPPSATPGTCDVGSIEKRTVDSASNLLACSEVTIGYIDQTGDAIYGRGDEVVVHIDHTYTTKTPLGDLLAALSFGTIPSTVQIRACGDARLEVPPTNQGVLVAGTGDCGS